jgi:hypothetical protein
MIWQWRIDEPTRKIASRRERLLPCPGDHNDPYIIVEAGATHGIREIRHRPEGQWIPPLRVVDGHRRYLVGAVVCDHGSPPTRGRETL